MKAFFAKIWAWVLANKVLSAIIAGGTAVVLEVAIAVPCGVSASKKRKAAQEQETQQSQPSSGGDAGGQGGSQQGGGEQGGGQQQGGGEQGGGQAAHEHQWSVAWSNNATTHWHACEGCTDKKDEAAHTMNPNGFCSVCGRYLGDEFAFEDQIGGYLDFVHDQMDMAADQVYFCRISGAISGHMYELEDGDPWGGAPGTNIDSAVSAYTMIDGQPHAVDLSGTVPTEIGSDGYLYIKLDASNLHNRKDVWFRICQLHANNDYGFCVVSETHEYYRGYELTLGVNRFMGSKAQNTKVYARFPYVQGRAYSYKVSCGGGNDWVFKAYRRTGVATVAEVNLNGADELEAAFGQQYIYIVIDIHTAVSQLYLEVWEGPAAPLSWQNIGFKIDRTYSGQLKNIDTAFTEDLYAGASALFDRVPITSGQMYTVYAQAILQPGEEITVKCYAIYNNAAQLLATYTGTGSNYLFLGDVLSQDGYLYFVAEADNGDPEEAIAVNLKLISVDENYFDSDNRFYGIQGYEAEDDTIEFEADDRRVHNENKFAFAFNAVVGDGYSLGGSTLDSSVSYEMYELHEVTPGVQTLVKLLDVNGICTASKEEVFVYVTFSRAIGAESFVVHQHHVTNASSYGYCANDYTFVGEEFSTEIQNSLTLSDNEYHYARFEFKAGHKYDIEYSTNSGYEVAYYLYNGSIWVETTLQTIQVTGVVSAQPYHSTKTYLYISFHRTDSDPVTIDIDIEEIHPANEYGYCDTCDVFAGRDCQLGVEFDLGVMHKDDVAFFRVPLTTGATHKVTQRGDVQTSDYTLIILEPDGGVLYKTNDWLKTNAIAEDGYCLIIKVVPTADFVSNGYLTVSLNS